MFPAPLGAGGVYNYVRVRVKRSRSSETMGVIFDALVESGGFGVDQVLFAVTAVVVFGDAFGG